MTTPVNFKLAKLLNSKGLPGLKSFYSDEKHYKLNPTKYTIGDVVMWLYENHGIWVDVSPCMTFKDGSLGVYEEKSFSFLYSIKYGTEELFLANSNEPLVFQKGFNSPEEAYEAAIEYCLTKLI